MIDKKNVKKGLRFNWDGERIEKKESGDNVIHIFPTGEGGHYSISKKSEYPTTFTVVAIDDMLAECMDEDGVRSIVIHIDDIMKFAHVAEYRPKSLPLKSLSDICIVSSYAEDMATTRQVLLQISRWLRTGHKELPFTLAEPFNDECCNTLYAYIVELMKEECKDE